jgi:hypothetical protein
MKKKNFIFCDIKPCSPSKVNQRFKITFRLHLQGWRVNLARNKMSSSWYLRWFCLPYSCTLNMFVRISADFTALYPTKQNTSWRPLWEPQTVHRRKPHIHEDWAIHFLSVLIPNPNYPCRSCKHGNERSYSINRGRGRISILSWGTIGLPRRTLLHRYTNRLVLHRELITVYSKIHTKHTAEIAQSV